ncbi:MAG: hypothetical protein AABW54_00565 [Candidatus Micrarchaeota archaeon]
MAITASAPNKVHLAGEHSVVYGGLALMAPVEVNGKRNRITLAEEGAPIGCEKLVFKGDLGTAILLADGSRTGDEKYFPMFEAALKVFEAVGFKLSHSGKRLTATLEYSGAPKGTGNSASIPAALAAALYAYFGKKPSKAELFAAAFVVDNAYHGGKSSGGDPQAVVSDCPQLFKRIFHNGNATPKYEDAPIALPKGTALLLIDSYRSGEKANTGALIAEFAKRRGITKTPVELSDAERAKIIAPFDVIVKKILVECQLDGDAKKLGALFDENHSLLRDSGVSAPDMAACITIAKQSGCLGAKGIGACGNGGAVIALCHSDKLAAVESALSAKGFKAFKINFATRGAGVD